MQEGDHVYSAFDLELSNPYYLTLSLASIYGLSPSAMFDDERSPFKLIRQPIYHLTFSLKDGRMLIGYKAALTNMSRCEIIVICFVFVLTWGAYLVAMIRDISDLS
jgi:hypothetical protein